MLTGYDAIHTTIRRHAKHHVFMRCLLCRKQNDKLENAEIRRNDHRGSTDSVDVVCGCLSSQRWSICCCFTTLIILFYSRRGVCANIKYITTWRPAMIEIMRATVRKSTLKPLWPFSSHCRPRGSPNLYELWLYVPFSYVLIPHDTCRHTQHSTRHPLKRPKYTYGPHLAECTRTGGPRSSPPWHPKHGVCFLLKLRIITTSAQPYLDFAHVR